MKTLSEKPKILLEEVSETARAIYFDSAVINTDKRHYSHLAGDLHMQTAGQITVRMEDLPYGRLMIYQNPALGDQDYLDEAVQILHKRLREMCTACSEFTSA